MRFGRKTRVALATGAALAVIGAGAVDVLYASHVAVEVQVVDRARCQGTDELGNWTLVPAGSREKLDGVVSVCVEGMWVDETGQ